LLPGATQRLLRVVDEAVGSDVLPFASETLQGREIFRPVSVETGDICSTSLEMQAEHTPQNDSGEVLAEEQKVEQSISPYKTGLPQRRSTRTREHTRSPPATQQKHSEGESNLKVNSKKRKTSNSRKCSERCVWSDSEIKAMEIDGWV